MAELARAVLENVAKALSDTSNKKVIFRGNECHTTGDLIVLPSLPDMVPEKIVVLLRGKIDHEIGHCINSDFEFCKRVFGPRFDVLNAVEDVWAEIDMCRRYPGCILNFERAMEYTIKDLLSKVWPELSPLNKILDLFIIGSRHGFDHPFVVEFGGEFRREIDLLMPEVEWARKTRSTAEALQVADSILAKLKARDEEVEKRKQKAMEEGGQGEKQDGEGEQKDQCSGDDKQDGDSGGQPENGDGAEQPSASEQEQPGAGNGEKQPGKESSPSYPGKVIPSSGDPSHGEMILPASVEKMIKTEAEDLKGYRVYSTGADTFTAYPVRSDGLDRYIQIKDDLSGLPAVLKNKLYRLLMSQKRSHWIGGKRSGFLNPAMAAYVSTGTTDTVFRDRHEGRKMNTAVSILCDLSGSMGREGKMKKEKEALVLLSEALSAIATVPFEILGFTGDSKQDGTCRDHSNFARWGSLDIYWMKLFDEPFGIEQKKRIGSMTHMDENYDGESVMVAANRLLARKEEKKVLCVLSDGYPHCSRGNRGYLNPHLREVTKRLQAIPNFHLLAFGILTDDPKEFYQNFIYVKDLSTLPMTLMSTFYKILVSS